MKGLVCICAFGNLGKKTLPEVVKLAKNNGFHRNIFKIYKKKKKKTPSSLGAFGACS